MARRKKQYISDDDPDSSGVSSEGEQDGPPDWDEDPDERAERLKFTDPYGRRNKRKRNGKEDALYGVFVDEGEDGSTAGPTKGNKALRR
jgi:tuftelin-interacting protein 11